MRSSDERWRQAGKHSCALRFAGYQSVPRRAYVCYSLPLACYLPQRSLSLVTHAHRESCSGRARAPCSACQIDEFERDRDVGRCRTPSATRLDDWKRRAQPWLVRIRSVDVTLVECSVVLGCRLALFSRCQPQ